MLRFLFATFRNPPSANWSDRSRAGWNLRLREPLFDYESATHKVQLFAWVGVVLHQDRMQTTIFGDASLRVLSSRVSRRVAAPRGYTTTPAPSYAPISIQ